MYTMYIDGELLYSPIMAKQEGYYVINPKVTLSVGRAGSASFVITEDNVMYNRIQKLKSIVTVKLDGKEIFRGRVINDEKDFYNKKNVYVEGDLAFLLDSPVRPYSYTGDIDIFFRKLLNNHNACVDAEKQFRIGDITVTDPNNYINRSNSNYSNTLDEIQDKLVDTHGGYLRTREKDGNHYLDYLEEYDNTNTQIIKFGENLLDISQYINAEAVFTCLIPLGAKIDDETGERLTIENVNDGLDYIIDEEAAALFGKIWKVETWDDVTVATNLLRKGKNYLKLGREMSVTLDINAIDLHMLNVDVESINIGDKCRVLSEPHGIDAYFTCTKITLNLTNPESNEYYFGAAYSTLTEKQANSARGSVTAINISESASESAQEAVSQVSGKQDKLTAGANITIDPVTNVISSTGGSSVVVDDEISSTSENPVQNKVIKAALDMKQDKLTAGANITIDPVTNVISSTGGSSVEVDDEISSSSENPVQNKVIKAALDMKQDNLTAGDNITIDPVTNVISATAAEYYQPLIYSTDEREVGVWTDGKPLYQKTFIVDNPQAGGQTYNLNISNLEKVVEQFGTWTRRWEAYGSISSWTYNINAENEIMPSFQPQFQVLARVRDTDGTFYIYYSTSGAYSGAVSQVRLTIQYTKTTDTAGSGIWTPSGVPAVHYSTDEQVVGTWTDGKPLYQKTISITCASDFATYDLGSSCVPIMLEGGACASNMSNLIPFGYVVNSNMFVRAYAVGSIIAVQNSYYNDRPYAVFTTKYTKTTD